MTNNIVSLTLAELVKSKAPAEKKKPEPEKAVTVEDLKKDPEPEPQPEPEEKKTAKRTITPKKEKVAKIEGKQPKKPEPVTKKNLLNTEIDI